MRPSYAFLSKHLDTLFSTESQRRHRCIAYAGLVADGTGEWFLSDSTFTPDRLLAKLRELDFKKPEGEAGEASVEAQHLHIVCPQPAAEWKALESKLAAKFASVAVNAERSADEVTGKMLCDAALRPFSASSKN